MSEVSLLRRKGELQQEGRLLRIGGWIWLLLVLVGLASGPLSGPLDRLGVIPRSAGFTELYFLDAQDLPSRISPGEPIEFAFGVANRTGRAQSYRAEVTSEEGGRRTQLASTSFRLEPGASTEVPVRGQLAPDGPSLVEVALEPPGEMIRFHLAPPER